MEFDTRLAAYAVVTDRHDRILLALWNETDPPRWTVPGGGVELHESVEEGAVREVREETGYESDSVVCWESTRWSSRRTAGCLPRGAR